MITLILLGLALIALIIGTITDIKTREVPDWINFGLIFAGIGLRFLYSAITSEWSHLLNGIYGLIAFVILGYIMFYAGQWGGGDSKMMMGLGAIIGLQFTLQPVPLILVFLLNVLLVGAVYGLVYSVVLAIYHRKAFVRNFNGIMDDEKMKKFRRIKLVVFILIIAITIFVFKGKTIDVIPLSIISLLIVLFYLSFYLIVFVKAVEKSSMFKMVDPEVITEGDWIAKDVVVDGKRITGPKDLGISMKQIKKLIELRNKGKIKKIEVKYGIPFVPSFLIAFLLSLFFGAWWVGIL